MDEEKPSVREDLGYTREVPEGRLPLDSKETYRSVSGNHLTQRTMKNLGIIQKTFPDAKIDEFGMVYGSSRNHIFWPSSDCYFDAEKQIYGIDIESFCLNFSKGS